MNVKTRVRAVIRKDGKMLLVQHVGHTTWCLPGGGIDAGENVIKALKREIREELGVDAQIGNLLTVHQFKHQDVWQGPEFFFEVLNVDDFNALDVTTTTHGATEIARVEFRDPIATDNLRPSFIPELITANEILVKLHEQS